MRSLLLAAALVGLAAPVASACPPLDACVVRLPSTVREVAAKPTPEAPARLVAAIRAPVAKRLAPGEIEMPWIWKTLREQVYSRMPTYEQPRELKLVLAPVVVTSPTDTVPGLGIAGDF